MNTINIHADTSTLVVAVFPACERVVTVNNVQQKGGVYVATAQNRAVNIGWLRCTNDQPMDGQRWLIRVLGFDVKTGIWIAHALMREE